MFNLGLRRYMFNLDLRRYMFNCGKSLMYFLITLYFRILNFDWVIAIIFFTYLYILNEIYFTTAGVFV